MSSEFSFDGIAAPLIRMNVDTDAIIPSREMNRVSKSGLADGLFANWRYLSADAREPNPDFILNQEPFCHATVLLSGKNFGCGSSREHAVWALKEWGIRAIAAPSFGAIFAANCLNNGVLPIRLEASTIEVMATAVTQDPQANRITVDLDTRSISMGDERWHFEIEERHRQMLLRGLSPIGLTLESEHEIEAFEAVYSARFPWAVL